MIAIWMLGQPVPDMILRGHEGPIAALAVSPDGKILAGIMGPNDPLVAAPRRPAGRARRSSRASVSQAYY
jgi:hypothetical protein